MQGESSKTWRELLGEIIRNPEDRTRLAAQLNVNPATLWRWATNTSNPRLNEIRALLRVLPAKQALLLDLFGTDNSELVLGKAPPSFEKRPPGEKKREFIPSSFYANTLRAARDAPQRFWTICSLILHHMLTQLDPQQKGMEIVVAQCMPAREGKVRSLRELIGQGTPPWSNSYPEEKSMFIGAESLGGYAVTHGHWVVIPDVRGQGNVRPIKNVLYEVSLAAFPVVLEGNIAGCILVSSTQVGYFTEERLHLLDDYADLMRLAFCDTDYHPLSSIELGIMPPWNIQKRYFTSFREQIAELIRDARQSEQLLDAHTAEQMVRQQLEDELLQLEKGATHDHANPSSI